MDVQTHEMDPRIARIHYRDYLARVRTNRETRKEELKKKAKAAGRELGQIRIEKNRLDLEDEELKTAYLELSREKRIVLMPEAIKKAGVDPKRHLPRLAVVKADASWCHFHGNNYVYFNRNQKRYRPGHYATFGSDYTDEPKKNIFLDRNVFPAETTNTNWRREQRNAGHRHFGEYPVRAMVPKVPPHLAPSDLSKYYILFEPKWEDEPPHLDPILLSRSSETVFVVVAVWDMTPIEASALTGR
jgi:hypothetical protein